MRAPSSRLLDVGLLRPQHALVDGSGERQRLRLLDTVAPGALDPRVEVRRTTARPLKSAMRRVTARASTISPSVAATASTASIGAAVSTFFRSAPTSITGLPEPRMGMTLGACANRRIVEVGHGLDE